MCLCLRAGGTSVQGVQKISDPLEPELQVTESPNMDAKEGVLILCMSSRGPTSPPCSLIYNVLTNKGTFSQTIPLPFASSSSLSFLVG